MRQICLKDFGIDPSGAKGKEARVAQSMVISAWELAIKRIEVQNEQMSQQQLQGLPHTLPITEHAQTDPQGRLPLRD